MLCDNLKVVHLPIRLIKATVKMPAQVQRKTQSSHHQRKGNHAHMQNSILILPSFHTRQVNNEYLLFLKRKTDKIFKNYGFKHVSHASCIIYIKTSHVYICLLHGTPWFQLFPYIHKSLKYITMIRGCHKVVCPNILCLCV
jgi:hypothetical protein